MIRTLLTLSILLSTLAAEAQVNMNKDSTNYTALSNVSTTANWSLQVSRTLTPNSFVFSGNLPKPVMIISFKKDGVNTNMNGGDWDTMQITIDKKNFYWLNDSTAVFIKPKTK